jgi:hypothetical protein
MILAHTTSRGGIPLLVIGLTNKNIEELKKGRPVFKGPEDTHLPMSFTIIWGETEDAILEDLKQHFVIPAVEDRRTDDP